MTDAKKSRAEQMADEAAELGIADDLRRVLNERYKPEPVCRVCGAPLDAPFCWLGNMDELRDDCVRPRFQEAPPIDEDMPF